MPGCSISWNMGFSGEQRGSSVSICWKVWYGPQHTPVPAKVSLISSRVRASTQGCSTAVIASRALKRSPSFFRSTPSSGSIRANRSASPVARPSSVHIRSVMATM